MDEGIGHGHVARYYEVVEQRFLGDKEFIEKMGKRVHGDDVAATGSNVAFGPLLGAVAEEHGVRCEDVVRAGRQRHWVRARAMLVYLAREWSRLSTKELAGRLDRDPSLMSRLYARYEKDRDRQAEARVARLLGKRISQ